MTDYKILKPNTNNSILPEFDTSEIPPLPAFQTQTEVENEIIPVPVQTTNNQNVTFMFVLPVILIVIICYLIKMYINLNNATEGENQGFSISSLLSKNENTLSGENNKRTNEEEQRNNKIESEEKNNLIYKESEIKNSSMQLGTPLNLSKCIKSFLEITREK